jgi:hypothetical protein
MRHSRQRYTLFIKLIEIRIAGQLQDIQKVLFRQSSPNINVVDPGFDIFSNFLEQTASEDEPFSNRFRN